MKGEETYKMDLLDCRSLPSIVLISVLDILSAVMAYSVKLLMGIIGNVTSLAMLLSPMATFWKIYKLKSTQAYSAAPYVCTLFNCSIWVLYGSPFVKPHSSLVLTINGTGFILELFYLLSFFIFSPKKTKVMIMRMTLAMTIALAVLVVATIFALHTLGSRKLVVGTTGVIFNIVMYGSPLSVMKYVIRNKSVECMPFLLSLFNAINGLVWSAYSVVTRDVFIGVPNGVGFILGMIQLTLYFIYRNSKSVLDISTELSKGNMIENGYGSPIQAAQVEKSNATKVETVDFLIPDQV